MVLAAAAAAPGRMGVGARIETDDRAPVVHLEDRVRRVVDRGEVMAARTCAGEHRVAAAAIAAMDRRGTLADPEAGRVGLARGRGLASDRRGPGAGPAATDLAVPAMDHHEDPEAGAAAVVGRVALAAQDRCCADEGAGTSRRWSRRAARPRWGARLAQLRLW